MDLQAGFLTFVFFCGIVANAEITDIDIGSSMSFQTDFLDSSSSCGGKLKASEGTISYKNFSPYSPNERCVWTIRAPNATSYNVQVDSVGNSDILMITGLGIGGLIRHSVPTSPSNVSMPNSNVLVVTFSTPSANNTNNYRGFSLRYTTSVIETNPKASATSEDIIASANAGHIKYPSGNGPYGNLELSVILINPRIGSDRLDKRTELVYIRSGLEGQSCQDRITIYAFDRSQSSTYRWTLLGRMCGGLDSELISSQDVLLIIFESDFSDTSSGFHLYSRQV